MTTVEVNIYKSTYVAERLFACRVRSPHIALGSRDNTPKVLPYIYYVVETDVKMLNRHHFDC